MVQCRKDRRGWIGDEKSERRDAAGEGMRKVRGETGVESSLLRRPLCEF